MMNRCPSRVMSYDAPVSKYSPSINKRGVPLEKRGLVEKGKPRLLERRQVTADRARRHLKVVGERIDRRSVAR